MMMPCAAGELCANGHGVCNGSEGVCLCDDPDYADQSDFLRSSGCQVYLPMFKFLWGVNLVAWASTAGLCAAAFLLVKRKTKTVQHFDKRHAFVCFVSSFAAIIFSALQLAMDSHSGSIAINPVTTIWLGISQTTCWAALVMKPSTKSETSIARFAMEQNKAIMSVYFIFAPIFMFCLVASSLSAIVGAFVSHETTIVVTYFSFLTIGFALLTIHLIIATCSTRRQLERALANSLIMSQRSSVRVRLERFADHAVRTMALASGGMIAMTTVVAVLAACEDCRMKALWATVPVLTIECAGWIFRSTFISLKTSLAHRVKEETKAAAVENITSGDANSPESPMQSVSKTRTRPKKELIKQTWKQHHKPMTIVIEAESEGTLARSQLDSFHGTEQRSPRGGPPLQIAPMIPEGVVTETSADGQSQTLSRGQMRESSEGSNSRVI